MPPNMSSIPENGFWMGWNDYVNVNVEKMVTNHCHSRFVTGLVLVGHRVACVAQWTNHMTVANLNDGKNTVSAKNHDWLNEAGQLLITVSSSFNLQQYCKPILSCSI